MCDYSLMEFNNRLAAEKEILLVHRFPSGSLGLASPADCERRSAERRSFWKAVREVFSPSKAHSVCAVCIPPGARLILHDVPARVQKKLALGPDEEVKFVQLSAVEGFHRDAVRFRNRLTLRLQELNEGQRVEVIDLGNADMEYPAQIDTLETMPVTTARRRS